MKTFFKGVLVCTVLTALSFVQDLNAQCPAPTPAGSCPSYGGCTYIPTTYFTFDNTCDINKDCISGTLDANFNTASMSLSNINTNPKVDSYLRLTPGHTSTTRQWFSDHFFPNGNYVNSGEYTFEFLIRVNAEGFGKIRFFPAFVTEFQLLDGAIFWWAVYENAPAPPITSVISIDLKGNGILASDYLLDKDWHHIVCRFDGTNGTMQLWIDGQSPGVLSTSIPPGSIPQTATPAKAEIWIEGMMPNESVDIDEVAFYDQALPSTVIYQHYLNTINGQHYDCNLNPGVTVPSPSNPLPNDYDTLDYVPRHAYGSGIPLTLDDLGNTVPSVLEQFQDYPLPRLKKGHTLNPNMNWMNNEYLGRVNKVPNGTNDIAVQEELCKNWNYMFNLNNDIYYGAVSYAGAMNTFANANPQYKYSVITNMFRPVNNNAVSPSPETLNVGTTCEGGAYDPYIHADSYVPTAATQTYFDSLGKFMFNSIVSGVINQSPVLTSNIDYISENGIEKALFFLDLNGCPYTDAAQSMYTQFPNTFGNWNSYYGYCRSTLETGYRNQIIGQHARIPASSKFSRYLVSSIYEHAVFEDYEQARLVNTPIPAAGGNTNYYSTPPFYIPKVNLWKRPGFGTNWGWNEMINNPITSKGRLHEFQLGDSLFAPYIAAGWWQEHENVRPGQWLGLLKGLGIIGADYYHTGYFNESPFPTGTAFPVDPRGWCYQAVMPSYAQGITSRFEKYLHASSIYFHRVTGQSFFVVRRNVHNPNMFLLYGSVQRLSNITGNSPVEVTYILNDTSGVPLLHGLKCKIRRQGSTYIFDSNATLFYQLDKWHESTHPSYWSKDFEFEAEVNDETATSLSRYTNDYVSTTMDLKTEVPPGTSPLDYTDYTTYIEYTGSKITSYYYFHPRSTSSSPQQYFLWVRARANQSATNGMSKIDVNIADANTTVIFYATIPCIDTITQDFKWYNFYVPINALVGTTPTSPIAFFLNPNEEYEISFAGNPTVEFDKFLLTMTPGTPSSINPAEVRTPCIGSNRPLSIETAGTDASLSKVKIYPNPSKGVFHVEAKSNEDYIQQITVFDILGKVAYSADLSDKRTTRTEVNLGTGKNTIYTLEVKTVSGTYREKVILSQ